MVVLSPTALDIVSPTSAQLLMMLVNVIAVGGSLIAAAVWLRKRAGKALRNSVVAPVTDLSNMVETLNSTLNKKISALQDDLLGKFGDLKDEVQAMRDELERAHDRLDRHLESHSMLSVHPTKGADFNG